MKTKLAAYSPTGGGGSRHGSPEQLPRRGRQLAVYVNVFIFIGFFFLRKQMKTKLAAHNLTGGSGARHCRPDQLTQCQRQLATHVNVMIFILIFL